MRDSFSFKLKLAVASILGLLATKYAKAESADCKGFERASGERPAFSIKSETGITHS